MQRKSLVIGIPTFGTVSMRWALAYGQLALPMNARVGRIVEQGREIGLARNRIVKLALEMTPKPTHIFFLDDDVIPPTPYPLVQLLTHNLDVVAGIYFMKSEYSEPIAVREPGDGVIPYVPNSGIHPVWGVPMGLTLIRTDVFERVRDELDLGLDTKGSPRWFYTSGDQVGEKPITEDMWFCQHLRQIGVQPYVDMHPHAFGWHFDKDTGIGYPRPQWEQFVKTGGMDWEVPDSFVQQGV